MMSAQQYWMIEMSNRAPSTKEKYNKMLEMFCDWLKKTPDQILEERKQDLKLEGPREKHRYETFLKGFDSYLKDNKKYSISSRQIAWAAIKSFFEVNYMRLETRRGDYPSGESLGHRGFTKDEIKQLLVDASPRIRAIIMILKDSAMRIGDLGEFKYNQISKQIDAGEEFISLKFKTQKSDTIARTFLGPEAIEAIKEYIEFRKKGTKRVKPEKIDSNSPLIRHNEKVSHVSRSGLSSLVYFLVKRAKLDNEVSAHSLRKYFQTQLEYAGVHPNWVQQMMGHKLTGVEGSYSRPSEKQLKETYIKFYETLRVFPKKVTSQDIKGIQEQLDSTKEENQKLKKEMVETNELVGFLETESKKKDQIIIQAFNIMKSDSRMDQSTRTGMEAIIKSLKKSSIKR